jgi:hypothetical protein
LASTRTFTTTAATLQTTAQPFGAGASVPEFEVVHISGTDVLWFTVDNTTPTVAGNDAYPVRPGERIGGLKFADQTSNVAADSTFKAISTTAVTYCLVRTTPMRTRVTS